MKKVFVLVLFIWILFIPPQVQENYGVPALLTLGLLLLAGYFLKKISRDLVSRRDWPVILFVIVLSAGICTALDKHSAWITYIQLGVSMIVLFYAGKFIARPGQEIGFISAVACTVILMFAFLGGIELVIGRNILYEQYVHNSYYIRYAKYFSRPMVTLKNPVILGSCIVGCIPFSFYFLKKKLFWARFFGICTMAAGIVMIVLSASRGVVLGLIAAFLFYNILQKEWRAVTFAVAGFLMLVAVGSFSQQPALRQFGFEKFFSGKQDSILSAYRFNRIEMTARMLKDHPWVGVGFQNFRFRFYEYSATPEGELVPYELMIPDNMYLSLAAESGLLGMLGLIFLLIFLFDSCGGIALLPLTGCAGLLVNMAGYDMFYWQNPFMLFCLLCGMAKAGER